MSRLFWLAAGLACVTLATLMLEVLDTRLLSVLAWYHLSFLAISVAMLGMAAGAVLVFATGARAYEPLLPRACVALSVAIVVSHLASLSIPFPPVRAVRLSDVATLVVATAALTLPFIVSGVIVAVALTRVVAPIGLMYGADLVGAAAGCVSVMALLNATDLSSIVFLIAAVAALAGWCFATAARVRARSTLLVGGVCLVLGWTNAHADRGLAIRYPKNRNVWPLLDTVEFSVWNSHSYVLVRRPEPAHAWMWGPGTRAPEVPAVVSWAMIDGEAGTPLTKWQGDVRDLGWVTYDVTSLAYRLRSGSVGIIGVGGGRDVLTALGTGHREITGIEINRTFLDLLRGPFRDFAGIADRPGVTLVYDEARSYLARTRHQFDVLQMSLVDTWASTGAGAFTLTENGLYTREAWKVFVRSLAPRGVMSVSRWYAPGAISETSRLVSLAVASLLDAGVQDPWRHVIVASAGRVATLLISPAPFSADDGVTLAATAADAGFAIELSPWTSSPNRLLTSIVHAASFDDLRRATADPNFDFGPPSDARPFFFNMVKFRAALRGASIASGGVVEGNLVATSTLFALLGAVALLALAILGWPLVAVGLPAMPRRTFAWSALYFSAIGAGFMFVQIPFLQRFAVYLGHPTYTFSIVLAVMILAAGGGSLSSVRCHPETGRPQVVALAAAGLIALEAIFISLATDLTQTWELAGRTLVVVGFVAPLAWVLGWFFPIGMRLVRRHSSDVTAWMWAMNGVCGVLASIVAVMVSIWSAIQTNLWIAAAVYLLLALPASALRRTR